MTKTPNNTLFNPKRIVNRQNLVKNPVPKSFAWLSITIFTICFFLIIAIRPTLITIAKLTKELKEKREANALLIKKIKILVSAQDEYVKNHENLLLLDEALPKTSQFAQIVLFLENTTNQSMVSMVNLGFENISFKKTPPDSSLPTYTLTIGAEGDYFSLKKFMSLLESSPRIIKIDNTTLGEQKLNQRTQGETGGKLLTTITGQVFFEKEKQ